MKPRLILSVALIGFVASGCTPVDYGFGETHRLNIAQQVIDPDPQHEGAEMEGGAGTHAADAIRRYDTGEVRQPTAQTTTSRAVGGSGGNGASGSANSQSGPR